MVALSKLRQAARASRALADKTTADPLTYFDPLPHQLAFLKCRSRKKLLRAGNRLGKTMAGAWETVLYALGQHPYDPGVTLPFQWVVCDTRTQSMTAQKTLYRFAKPYLAPGFDNWSPKTGLGLHTPKLVFRNGSEVEIKTIGQGAMKLTSAQVQRVWFDEPPSNPRLYSEAVNRTRTAGGRVCLTFTPVNVSPDIIDWLRGLTEQRHPVTDEPMVTDLHFPLTAAAFVHTKSGRRFRTDDGEPCDEDWIVRTIADQPEHEVPVTIHGEWNMRSTERWFSAFVSAPDVEGSHVAHTAPDVDLDLYLGIDHGTGEANQIAILIGVEKTQRESGYRRIWALDEVWSESITTPQLFGRDVVAMLARWGWSWRDLEKAYGDIPATDHRGSRIGNRDVEDAVRRHLGLSNRRQLKPRIFSAKRGEGRGGGSHRAGMLWLHQRMVAHDFRVLTRCEQLIASLDKWKQEPKSPYKHAIDGLHYACIPQIRLGPGKRGPRIGLRSR